MDMDNEMLYDEEMPGDEIEDWNPEEETAIKKLIDLSVLGLKYAAYLPGKEGDPLGRRMRDGADIAFSGADEMLYPENRSYLDDVLSYEAIGARSVENQEHRLTVSGIDIPAGMKNPTSGDLAVMLNSVYAAQHPHHFSFAGHEVETTGNPWAHVILRGAVSKHGNSTQNYHYEDIMRLIEKYDKMDVVNPAAIIDTNHSNSGKKYNEQVRIAKEVMNNRQYSSDIKKMVKGLMIESYLEPGNQKIGCGNHVYGKSITDPCLGWDQTERLIYDIAEEC